jgi:hypothetical protein
MRSHVTKKGNISAYISINEGHQKQQKRAMRLNAILRIPVGKQFSIEPDMEASGITRS